MEHSTMYEEGLQVAPSRDGGLETNREGIEVRPPFFKRSRSPTVTEIVPGRPPIEYGVVKRKSVCGLTAAVSYSLLVIATVLITIIVCLGAILGADKHSNASKSATGLSPSTTASSPSTTTTTSTNSATASPLPPDVACAGNGTFHTTTTDSVFQLWCNYDFVVNSDDNLWDYRGIPTFGACMDACSLWNKFQTAGTACKSVSYGTTDVDYQHCWLKSIAGSLTEANGFAATRGEGRESANLVNE